MALMAYILKLFKFDIILLDYIGIEGTRLSSEISYTRTDLTA